VQVVHAAAAIMRGFARDRHDPVMNETHGKVYGAKRGGDF
jgi:hypothetical protein